MEGVAVAASGAGGEPFRAASMPGGGLGGGQAQVAAAGRRGAVRAAPMRHAFRPARAAAHEIAPGPVHSPRAALESPPLSSPPGTGGLFQS